MSAIRSTPFGHLDPQTQAFYLRALDVVEQAGMRYAVGGAYAMAYHAGIVRHTKDLDLFLRREDLPRALAACESAGFSVDRTHPHWLAKAFDTRSDAIV